MQNRDVIILGDGIVAKSLALALGKLGLQTTRIAPRRPDYQNDPRSYAIAPSSLNVFNALGVNFSNKDITHVSRVEIGFGERLETPLYPFSKSSDMFVMIDHAVIDRALQQQLDEVEPEAECIDAKLQDIIREPGKIILPEFDCTAPLLLIAEGKHGETLAHLGFAQKHYDYHQSAITAKFRTSIAHGGVARQLFENTGPLGLLPFGKDGLSIVWSQNQNIAEALMRLDDSEFLEHLQSKIGTFYGTLEWISPRNQFPLKQSLATRITQERVALIGDSGHVVHPVAGQGLNLGLRDVGCMVEVIRQSLRIGLDIGEENVLAQYAQWRKADINRLDLLTRGLNDLSQGKNPLFQAFRTALMPALAAKPVQNWLANMSDARLDPEPPLLRGMLV